MSLSRKLLSNLSAALLPHNGIAMLSLPERPYTKAERHDVRAAIYSKRCKPLQLVPSVINGINVLVPILLKDLDRLSPTPTEIVGLASGDVTTNALI